MDPSFMLYDSSGRPSANVSPSDPFWLALRTLLLALGLLQLALKPFRLALRPLKLVLRHL